jgi:nucleoside-diphosphate-sugar epimerase
MSSRREFLNKAVALASASALSTTRVSAAQGHPGGPLRVLILGGTGFIGPYFVRAAVARGHRVSVFNRGRDHAQLPKSVEHLIGDRNADLHAITNRDWDAVIDDATYGPAWVRSLGEALRGRVKHYTFVSTISVYDTSVGTDPRDEFSPVLKYHGRQDPYSVTTLGPDYGALKALCEQEAERQFPGRTAILRLGSIVDLRHQDEAVTYWPVRLSQGGEVMGAGDPSWPIQFIDVRDLARWVIRISEKNGTGIYNTVGPASPMNLGQMIEAAHLPPSRRVTWVSAPWLAARNGDQTWNVLLFWYENRPVMRMNIGRALRLGLTTRPVSVTMNDALRWHQNEPLERRGKILTAYRKKAEGSGMEPVILPWGAYLERERETLAAWHAQAHGHV